MNTLRTSGITLVLLGLAAIVAGQVVTPRTTPRTRARTTLRTTPRPTAQPAPRESAPPSADNGVPNLKFEPTAEEIARSQRALAEAYRYKGTTVVTAPDLEADEEYVKHVSGLLSKADFIPQRRLQRFARLAPDVVVVGWHLEIEKLEVREADILVRVRAAPFLRSPRETVIGVLSYYLEDYRIVGGKLQFVGSEPLPADLSIYFATG